MSADKVQAYRACVRPSCVILMCLTLCIGVMVEQLTGKAFPWWFSAGAGVAVVEWITERAITRNKQTKQGE